MIPPNVCVGFRAENEIRAMPEGPARVAVDPVRLRICPFSLGEYKRAVRDTGQVMSARTNAPAGGVSEGGEPDGPAPAGPLVRTVALVGLMGVGKSTVGRKLADSLSSPFVDSDEEIEKAAGLSRAGNLRPAWRAGIPARRAAGDRAPAQRSADRAGDWGRGVHGSRDACADEGEGDDRVAARRPRRDLETGEPARHKAAAEAGQPETGAGRARGGPRAGLCRGGHRGRFRRRAGDRGGEGDPRSAGVQ